MLPDDDASLPTAGEAAAARADLAADTDEHLDSTPERVALNAARDASSITSITRSAPATASGCAMADASTGNEMTVVCSVRVVWGEDVCRAR